MRRVSLNAEENIRKARYIFACWGMEKIAGLVYLNAQAADNVPGFACHLLVPEGFVNVKHNHLLKIKHNGPTGTIIAESTKNILV